MLDKGKVSRGRLGVGVQSINQDLAASFGLSVPNGALVTSVEKNGPADKAGVEPGDVILKYNGQPIERSSDLPPLVAESVPGKAASIEVWRNKQAKILSVKVDEMKTAQAQAVPTAESNQAKLGVSVRPLTDDEKAQVQIKQGLLVEEVVNGPAAQAGIQPGDVILAVNGDQVSSVKQLRDEVQKNGKSIALLVMRGDNKVYVPIKIG